MTRIVFATRPQCQEALTSLTETIAKIKAGKLSLRAGVELLNSSSGRNNFSRSALQRWLHQPTPTIGKTRSGFYLQKSQDRLSTAFTQEEEERLLTVLRGILASRQCLEVRDLERHAEQLAKEILGRNPPGRVRLAACKFGRKWVSCFVSRHAKIISHIAARPVEHVRLMAFNVESIAEYMAQVELAYSKYSIKEAWQILNLDETGFSPGRDLTGKTAHKVIASAGKGATWSNVGFKYPHRISFLACVSAAGDTFLPAPIFRGLREPFLSTGCYSRKVSELMPQGWKAFWRKDVASVDSAIFYSWSTEFIKEVRSKYGEQDWLILFWDGYRAHMTYRVINMFRANKVAVIALPAHSSDRTQPLDVSVFGPFKHYANLAVAKRAKEQTVVDKRFEKLARMDIREAIVSAFGSAFTAKNIFSGFKMSGLWPCNH